jgi:NAD(P)-dependent dehydrogenase (short-subunit alcohol dehydrogenase family)
VSKNPWALSARDKEEKMAEPKNFVVVGGSPGIGLELTHRLADGFFYCRSSSFDRGQALSALKLITIS